MNLSQFRSVTKCVLLYTVNSVHHICTSRNVDTRESRHVDYVKVQIATAAKSAKVDSHNKHSQDRYSSSICNAHAIDDHSLLQI